MKTIQLPRTLAVIDIENLCGGAVYVPHLQKQIHEIFSGVQRGPTMTVLAMGPLAVRLCPTLLWEWSGTRKLIRSGVNGADSALLEVLEFEPLCKRVDRVQIWSGDGCFADVASKLRCSGIQVEVYAIEGSVSRRLAREANSLNQFRRTGGVLNNVRIAASGS